MVQREMIALLAGGGIATPAPWKTGVIKWGEPAGVDIPPRQARSMIVYGKQSTSFNVPGRGL